jgi:hypothetical protein
LKVTAKARGGKKTIFQNLGIFLRLIGSKNSCTAVFLVYKVIKAKKTMTRPNHRKSQKNNSKVPNLNFLLKLK